nr:uncharacterized protein LOC113397788 [Vanessa tameamea]
MFLKQCELLCKSYNKQVAFRDRTCNDSKKMYLFYIFISMSALLYRRVQPEPAGPIGTFLQTNLIGFPVIHESQAWIFDPDVSSRRRKEFIELNGDKAAKLIERLGLGIDGYGEQRLKMQRQRDQGHLGGLNSLRP